jgi:hypothetical protein
VRICLNPKPRRFSRKLDSHHEKAIIIRNQSVGIAATLVGNQISVEITSRKTSKNDTKINFISVIIKILSKWS